MKEIKEIILLKKFKIGYLKLNLNLIKKIKILY